jgi:hypothetical protein
MCGRYVSVQERADLSELYDAMAVGEELAASYNVAPTSDIYAVVEHADPRSENVDRQIRNLQWGLVPSWAKDPSIGDRLINARVETLADKRSWRGPFRRQRAVIPAAGTTSGGPANTTPRSASSPTTCIRSTRTGCCPSPACMRCGATRVRTTPIRRGGCGPR